MRQTEWGATIVEFALVLIVFLMFFLGILDFARMLWTWNAANEATRWGARVSVVCDKGAAAVLASMQKFVPQLSGANLQIDWYDATGTVSAACDHTNCAGVNVTIGCDGCGSTIPGTVDYVSDKAEYTPPVLYSKENRGKLVFLVEAHPAVADAAKLKPGEPVDVTLP